MKRSIRQWLGIEELEDRVDQAENKLRNIEADIRRRANQLGDYKRRTNEELEDMRAEINSLLRSVEALIEHNENQESIDDAKRLRARLRNNKTRISNQLSA